MNYTQMAETIASEIRSLGYSKLTYTRTGRSWVHFYYSGKFLFSADLQLISYLDCKSILKEILEGKTDVHLHA